MPLGISHWRIDKISVVDEIPGRVNAKATVQPSHAYDSVIFWFQSAFVEGAGLRDLDETIIHEWAHVFMRDFDQAIESVEYDMATGARERWSDWVGHEREGVVDRLARTLYVLYMAPEDAKPGALRRLSRSVD